MRLGHIANMGAEVAILVSDYAFSERQGLILDYAVYVGRIGRLVGGEFCVRVPDMGAFPEWEILSSAEVGLEQGASLLAIRGAEGLERGKLLARFFETHGQRPSAVHLWSWGSTVSRHIGFQDCEGIFLTRPGSNSAIGSFQGGFPSIEAARDYVDRYLSGTGSWPVIDSRPKPEAASSVSP